MACDGRCFFFFSFLSCDRFFLSPSSLCALWYVDQVLLVCLSVIVEHQSTPHCVDKFLPSYGVLYWPTTWRQPFFSFFSFLSRLTVFCPLVTRYICLVFVILFWKLPRICFFVVLWPRVSCGGYRLSCPRFRLPSVSPLYVVTSYFSTLVS